MAEGWARRLKGDLIEPYSAGIEKHGLNPHAVKVMAEAGVDISKHCSKTPADLGPLQFDYVVTVCGEANEQCPIFSGKAKVMHVGFDDPPKITRHLPDGQEKLSVYRRVRDEIRRFIETLPATFENENLMKASSPHPSPPTPKAFGVREERESVPPPLGVQTRYTATSIGNIDDF